MKELCQCGCDSFTVEILYEDWGVLYTCTKCGYVDICSGRPLPKTCRPVSQLPPPDPIADMYGRVRDAVICCDSVVGCGTRIGVLELVKAELLRGMQAQIDEG